VLATIPDLASPSPAATGPRQPLPVEKPRPSRPLARTEEAASAEAIVPKRKKRPADRPLPRRRKSRAIFPSGSITVLAVIAAAIWSYVAIRDRAQPDKEPVQVRLAAEPASAGTGTTRQ
jgi:hypothetical protein